LCFTFAKYAHIFCWSFEFWVGIWTLIAIVGDITPSNGVPKQEKSRLEQAALNEMCWVLGGLRVTQILNLAILTFSSFSFEFSGTKYFQLKRSKSYGRSMKTMLPWRPTLSKTLTKFEFLNDAIRNRSMVPNASSIDFLAIAMCSESHWNTGQYSNQMCLPCVSYILIYFWIIDDQSFGKAAGSCFWWPLCVKD